MNRAPNERRATRTAAVRRRRRRRRIRPRGGGGVGAQAAARSGRRRGATRSANRLAPELPGRRASRRAGQLGVLLRGGVTERRGGGGRGRGTAADAQKIAHGHQRRRRRDVYAAAGRAGEACQILESASDVDSVSAAPCCSMSRLTVLSRHRRERDAPRALFHIHVRPIEPAKTQTVHVSQNKPERPPIPRLGASAPPEWWWRRRRRCWRRCWRRPRSHPGQKTQQTARARPFLH